MTLFSAADYAALHALVFRDDYPGYRPHVTEAPNGDGVQDRQKKFAHVASKYLPARTKNPDTLWQYLLAAHDFAFEKLCWRYSVPDKFHPCIEYSALRVLEYPAMVGGHRHTDFDLFTINCYRNRPNDGLPAGEVHMGELGELLGLGPATPHEVLPTVTPQHSIVFFAIPDHAAVLPSGQTVGAWLAERVARSRVYT